MRVIALLTVLVAFTAVFAQSDGGCCFFRQKGFKDEIRCSNEPLINISTIVQGKVEDAIQSYFCTETYSAAVFHKGEIKELIDCGDVVNETTIPMPVSFVTVGECLLRRCCFYTGSSKDGVEYCVNDAAASAEELARVQSPDTFLVAECVREFAATLTTSEKKVIQVGCGETVDIPKNTKFSSITVKNCPPAKATEDEFTNFGDQLLDPAVIDSFDTQVNADQNLDSNFVSESEFVEQAVGDSLEATFTTDQSLEQNMESHFVDDAQFVDQAVGDSVEATFTADQSLEQNMESNFDDAQFVDQAVGDSVEATFVEQAVGDSLEATFSADQSLEQNMESNFVDDAQFVDQAVGDSVEATFTADQSLEQNLDAAFVGEEQFVDPAVGDSIDSSFEADMSFEEAVEYSSFSDSFNEEGSSNDERR